MAPRQVVAVMASERAVFAVVGVSRDRCVNDVPGTGQACVKPLLRSKMYLLMRSNQHVGTEMSLHVLACNLKWVISIVVKQSLIASMRA